MKHIDEEFIDAVQNNDPDAIAELLERGANIHANSDYALRWSATRGHLDMVAKLLEYNANLHAYDDSALQLSAQNGHLCVVSLLLERDANLHAADDHALRWSARNNHLDVVMLLLERGANVSTNVRGHYSALEFSAKHNRLDVVTELLKWNADVHADNDNALRLSITHDNYKMTEKLLENGANIRCHNKCILKQLQAKFDEELASVILPYCGAADYEYFPEWYIKAKIVPTKNARTRCNE